MQPPGRRGLRASADLCTQIIRPRELLNVRLLKGRVATTGPESSWSESSGIHSIYVGSEFTLPEELSGLDGIGITERIGQAAQPAMGYRF